MRHRVRFVLTIAAACLLIVPSAAGAAFTGYTGPWQQTVSDPKDQAAGLEQMDLQSISRAYDGGFYYFQLDAYADILPTTPAFADYYGIYIKKGIVDTTEPDWYTSYNSDYYVRLNEKWALATKNVTGPEWVIVNGNLQWKFAASGLESGYSWWAVTQKGDGINVSDYAIAPIPNAFWLLGSGLVGLIGLRRRIRK
jgi:hypothetical protein